MVWSRKYGKTTLVCMFSMVAMAASAFSEPLAVPSGQPITFHESIWGARGPSGLTMRFRFITPEIARTTGSVDFESAEIDMAYLCETYAVPRLSQTGPQVSQIIISFADRELEFGYAAPEATQFFEAYRRDGTSCIWEGF